MENTTDPVADLHTHTIHSDGVKTVAELFALAKEKCLAALSITDHDTTNSFAEAEECAAATGIEFVPGLELSCFENGRDYHLLGYCIDPDNSTLKHYLDNYRIERERRAERIVAKLRRYDSRIEFNEVLVKAGIGTVGRPHVAAVMVKNGISSDNKEAFKKYLNPGKPAFEPKPNFTVEQGIKLINNAGGIAVLAHPGSTSQTILSGFVERGLDGIEVTHPIHPPDMQQYYRNIASHYWLIGTGGSDFHGNRDYDFINFGVSVAPYSVVQSLRRARQKR
ncbi:PHP domain-containing protein [Ignavibacteria bacterium]|nr:PHP domain-containing protein [Bacteroidota bacterium]MCZ2132056.1 PHP domain-containing protein [Bacteroidota bacterium]